MSTLVDAGTHRRCKAPARSWPRPDAANLLTALIAVTTVAGAALIVAADLADRSVGYETWDVVAFLAVFPLLPLMGHLLCRRVPGNPIGWLFLGAALAIAASAVAHGYGDFALYAHPGSLPAAEFVVWTGWVGWLGFGALAVGVPLLFPDGRLLDRRWAAVAVLGAAAVLTEAAVLALRPGAFPDFPAADFPAVVNPVGIAGAGEPLRVLHSVAAGLFLGSVLLALASLVWRYRAGGPTERSQVSWLAGVTAALVGIDVVINRLTGGALHDHPALCTWGAGAARGVYGTVVPMLLYLGVPAAVALAILRHRLYDLDRLVRRSVVFGGLSLAITLAYVALAATFGIAAGQRLPLWAAVLGTIAATWVFTPLRARLEQFADRLVFGVRKSRYQLVTEFAAGLREGADPTDLAPRLAATVRTGLGLRWARVRLHIESPSGSGLRTVAENGTPDEPAAQPVRTVALTHAGEQLGVLECGPPSEDGDELSPADEQLLAALADQASLALRNARLATELTIRLAELQTRAEELAASRSRVVEAADAERRRIERNIHDGAQQEIVGLIAKLRLARNHLPAAANGADAALEAIAADARAMLDGLRELARGIHPSVLTDRGLLAALETQADRAGLPVRIEADPQMSGLRWRPEVEGTAYFVAGEAITNAVKHSGAGAVLLQVGLLEDPSGPMLRLEIRDDGVGFVSEPGARHGGLANLTDRVDAVGGRLEIRAAPSAGCLVRVDLPVNE